ncbi:DNA polymerase Y family protein [Belnapia arida]|uniref:DNA polymerase Y family protein n=1 Tax=Belnapia arida TaxID=2804533 RepID=UPI002E2C7741|nr:DNA polymerase Y family protein [Belnapia arida]
MMGRFLALHLPHFATDRIRRAERGLSPDWPLAVWATQGSRRLLAAVDAVAEAAGLRPGQPLADAQAMLPALLLRQSDPVGEAQALAELALWARRYTPLAAAGPPDGLLLDITGCTHLHGGEAPLLQEALGRLRRAGIAARGAIAGAAATAGALARARSDNPIAVSGTEAAVAGPLPVGLALRLPPAMLQSLASLGLHQVHALAGLPRGPLARRFGQDLLDRLDAVVGRRPSPIQPALPPPELSAAREMLEPIVTRSGIDAVLDRLLDELCDRLRTAGVGVRQLTLLAWRVDGAVQEVPIGTGQPMREAAHLRRLFATRLERLEPGLGFERMALEARATQPMTAGMQPGLAIGNRAEEADAELALAQLLDRLGQRLRVRRVAPRASHWPDHAVAALDPQTCPPPMPEGWAAPAWPVLRLRRPQPLEVAAALPEAMPALLHWGGRTHRLRRLEGPLRLEAEWWRAQPGQARRDYYRVELDSGLRLWLCHAQGRWALHGHLP